MGIWKLGVANLAASLLYGEGSAAGMCPAKAE